MIERIVFLACFALLASWPAYSHDYNLGNIAIGHPWARPTAQGTDRGAAYLTLENKGGEADRLVSVSSPVAGSAQIHQTTDEGGVMKMHEVAGGIELTPGASVALKPGGYHIMFLDLKQKLEDGQRIPLTLTFAKAGSIDVQVHVEKTSEGGHDTMGMDHKMH